MADFLTLIFADFQVFWRAARGQKQLIGLLVADSRSFAMSGHTWRKPEGPQRAINGKADYDSMMLNDVTVIREEVLFQKSFHVNSAAPELSGVNIMHYDRISSPISRLHRQTAEILQMQAQVLSKISNFVNVQGSVRSLIAYAELQFERFHVDFRDVPFDQ